ncbi:hypothetical protein BGZ96_007831 [Linnemannia gamsii]|uniref:Uncharacterized protein n=1 Tax=Linnemannia gamsii TaxID=64522 RepID=A0ABQ7JZS3_9FUNG|nr:hypothetical protein BGZ96_007831 [Linnemannia gamsii]
MAAKLMFKIECAKATQQDATLPTPLTFAPTAISISSYSMHEHHNCQVSYVTEIGYIADITAKTVHAIDVAIDTGIPVVEFAEADTSIIPTDKTATTLPNLVNPAEDAVIASSCTRGT